MIPVQYPQTERHGLPVQIVANRDEGETLRTQWAATRACQRRRRVNATASQQAVLAFRWILQLRHIALDALHTNLVHELLDAIGAEQEQAEDLAVLACVVDELGGGCVQLRARVPVASSQWARESACWWLAIV